MALIVIDFVRLLLLLLVSTQQHSEVTRPGFVNHLEIVLIVSNGGHYYQV